MRWYAVQFSMTTELSPQARGTTCFFSCSFEATSLSKSFDSRWSDIIEKSEYIYSWNVEHIEQNGLLEINSCFLCQPDRKSLTLIAIQLNPINHRAVQSNERLNKISKGKFSSENQRFFPAIVRLLGNLKPYPRDKIFVSSNMWKLSERV